MPPIAVGNKVVCNDERRSVRTTILVDGDVDLLGLGLGGFGELEVQHAVDELGFHLVAIDGLGQRDGALKVAVGMFLAVVDSLLMLGRLALALENQLILADNVGFE